MQRMPKSCNAQGACSREEPQPKLRPATKMLGFWYLGSLKTKSGLRLPSSLNRQLENKNRP